MSESMAAESSTAARRVTSGAKPEQHARGARASANPSSGREGGDGDEDEDEDGDAMDIKTLQSYNQKIQRFPVSAMDLNLDPANPFNPPAAQKIIIPKRGEKDFEPLSETVNLQEMMLQQSREALFEALTGVRGGSSNNMSHALLTPNHPFPHMLITRGNVAAAMGHTVRSGKKNTRMELLPEEALYMAERGSLQLWYGTDEDGNGVWSDEIFGVVGATEMSVMEAYATFIGKEGLTLERYQAYAYLKRLGYTVQRTRTFLPRRIRDAVIETRTPAARFSLNSVSWLRPDRLMAAVYRQLARVLGRFGSVLRALTQRGLGAKHTLLAPWHGSSYRSLFAHLRIIPSGHSHPVDNPSRPAQTSVIPSTDTYAANVDQYQALESNPYIPFFHVWQPSVAWSRRDWLKGSGSGLAKLPPNFWLAVISVRSTSLPSLAQISEVFDVLPHDPAPEWKPRGARAAAAAPAPSPVPSRFTSERTRTLNQSFAAHFQTWWQRLTASKAPASASQPQPHAQARSVDMHLKQGDRTLVVATADSGNIGWVRLGRGGFDEYPVV